jgi:type II secretory pathway pseudopilin PulG
MSSLRSTRGFTLIETVVATGILVTALAGLAQLMVLSAHLTRQASASGMALAAAQDKLESLRGLAFTFDAEGVPITSPGLQRSPAESLDADLAPAVDWIDARGESVAAVGAASYARRWRISTVADAIPDAIAIEVCVFKTPAAGLHSESADACLATIRTRQP